jgi:competence protein ComEC
MGGQRLPVPLVLGLAVALALALGHTAEIRARADAALAVGMPEREFELSRGFVLGEDEGIDPQTVEDFRRSGLSHLLAVSGQNVALLALLAMPVLAAFGIPLRSRLLWVLCLIAIYVPLAGAGPSLQRAGVMGALAVIATLAGRRTARFYALAVAVVVTLAIDPRNAADVGWQLSFAAVVGILLLVDPLRTAILVHGTPRRWLRAVVDAMAMTIAATLATAPLIVFHFGALSTTTLIANLLALPAVAPAMWLGMLAVAAGQVPGMPVAILNAIDAPLLGYIAQVAAWCGRPSWAYMHIQLGSFGLVASYLVIAVAVVLLLRWRRRRWLVGVRRKRELRWRRSPRITPVAGVGLAAGGLVLAAATWALLAPTGGAQPPGAAGLRISVLDVGQGDAILLQPAGAPAVLIDGGPPEDDLAEKLRVAGVDRLGATVVTHDQADHAGGIAELLQEMPIDRLLYSELDGRLLQEAELADISTRRLSAGSELRVGLLRLQVLWPPRELLRPGAGVSEPNQLSLVMLARWHRFSMLLTADAEAETTPIETGPIDVLKVAHHGSDDPGLARLLERTSPKLAVVSVGAGNPFGHPTARTLAVLASHGVRTLRTDLDGTVVLDIVPNSLDVTTGR